MKLDAALALIQPFLAADKKPEDLKAVLQAADKAAKDAAGSGLGSRNLEEADKPNGDKAAKDKAAKDKAAKDKAAKDKAAKDRADDPEGTNDADIDAEDEKEDMDAEDADADAEDEDVNVGNPTTPGGSRAGGKTAVDSAEVDRRIAAAVAGRDALHAAQREVEPILGRVAFDSAPKAYRAALAALNIDHKGVPNSALPAMLKLAKDRAAPAKTVTMDSAGVKSLEAVIPGYGRLR